MHAELILINYGLLVYNDTTTDNININNKILFTNTDVGDPNVLSIITPARSNGTKIVLKDSLSSEVVDYAIGIADATQWFSVASLENVFKWFFNTTLICIMHARGLVYKNKIYTYNNTPIGGIKYTSSDTYTILPTDILGGIFAYERVNPAVLTLPTAADMRHYMVGGIYCNGRIDETLYINQGVEWTIINYGHSMLTIQNYQSAERLDVHHKLIGNPYVNGVDGAFERQPTSVRFFTRITSNITIAETYRLS